uniref:Uncharacterized protein n=1 Tax=Rhizophora mucronata TaxID=61149 RepID=A0A2P2NLC8_RHIMU
MIGNKEVLQSCFKYHCLLAHLRHHFSLPLYIIWVCLPFV